jgi:hypothetical protein
MDLRFLSRREFLKLSGASLLSLYTLAKTSPVSAFSGLADESAPSMGRIVTNNVKSYDTPSLDGKVVKTYWKDLVLPITSITTGGGEPSYNPIWYQINGEGYVHSGNVQPVEIKLNELVTNIPAGGQLAEITVPYSDAIWHPILKQLVAYRLYYQTTHWVVGTFKDDSGQTWYEILEDFYQFHFFVNSSHVRLIPADEVSTLSPDVPASDNALKSI